MKKHEKPAGRETAYQSSKSATNAEGKAQARSKSVRPHDDKNGDDHNKEIPHHA